MVTSQCRRRGCWWSVWRLWTGRKEDMIRCNETTSTSSSGCIVASPAVAAASQHHARPNQDVCHLRSEARPWQSLCRQPCVATWTPGMLSCPARPQPTMRWCIARHGSPCAWHLSNARSDPLHVTTLLSRSHKIQTARRHEVYIRGNTAVVSMTLVPSPISTFISSCPDLVWQSRPHSSLF